MSVSQFTTTSAFVVTMGHPVDIFATASSSSYICAICRDVSRNAIVMKECGHSFCDECANACLSINSCCPTCRTAVSGTVPNFLLRGLVNALTVKCPHRGVDGSESESKHRRGNDGKVIDNDRCTWTGTCEDYPNHEAACEYKVIACDVVGCDHTCCRRDMNDHLTGSDFFRHIKLVEETNLERYKGLVKRDKEEIAGLQRQVKELKRRIKILNAQVSTHTFNIAHIEKNIDNAVEGLLQIMKSGHQGHHINDVTKVLTAHRFTKRDVLEATHRLVCEGCIYTTFDDFPYLHSP